MDSLLEHAYNPDVLSCLANLSNDEVFTPPELANQVLDMLPPELWESPDTKILDPCCKSGVFLREAAKRLIRGLEPVYPDLQERVDHIMHEQLYAIAITELTSLLSRRSVYCSKYPNGRFSVSMFDDDAGNVRYRNINHTWRNGRCEFCGASESEYRRDASLETHAYELIHTSSPERIFNMKFDVIVGNPPYQLSDGGYNASAMPIYQKFVEQAKKLNPRYLTMIIPSRWFTGGRGLDDFRESMLHDHRLSKLVDYANASEVFPGVDMSGGVCYFLWERNHNGTCEVVNVLNDEADSMVRKLDANEIFVRSNRAVAIVDKVASKAKSYMRATVSSQKPFGLRTYAKPSEKGELTLRWSGGRGPVESAEITVGRGMIDKYKVIVSRVVYEHAGQSDSQGQRRVLSILEVLRPKEVCTETYIVVDTFDSEEEALNCQRYLACKLSRFLIGQVATSQMVNKKSFSLVPAMDFTQAWDDEALYAYFGLTEDEVEYVESTTKEYPLGDGDEDA